MPKAWCTTASSSAGPAGAIAIDLKGLTGGERHGLRPDRSDARPDGRARGRGRDDRLRSRKRERARLRRRRRRCVTLPEGRRDAARSSATSSPAATAFMASAAQSVPPERAARLSSASIRSAGSACSRTRRRCPRSSSTSTTSAASRCAACAPRPAAAITCNVSLDERVEEWPDERFWDELRRRLDARRARPRHRPLDREEHRAAAQLRRRADALRPAVPRGRCRAHRAAHRREGPQSRGERRALPFAKRCVEHLPRAADAGLDSYSARALARVWKAERFSWWMTMLLHRFPDRRAFRAEDPAGRARLSRGLAGGADRDGRELRGAAVLT